MEKIRCRRPGSIISKVYLSDNSMDLTIGDDGEYREDPKIEFKYVEYDSRLNINDGTDLDRIIALSRKQRLFCRYYTFSGGKYNDSEYFGTMYGDTHTTTESGSGCMFGTSTGFTQTSQKFAHIIKGGSSFEGTAGHTLKFMDGKNGRNGRFEVTDGRNRRVENERERGNTNGLLEGFPHSNMIQFTNYGTLH